MTDADVARIIAGPESGGAVGGYRATSMAINTAGVQLDANMADFRFPPSLR